MKGVKLMVDECLRVVLLVWAREQELRAWSLEVWSPGPLHDKRRLEE